MALKLQKHARKTLPDGLDQYVSLPDTLLNDQSRLAEIIASAWKFATALPPKVKKPRKKKSSYTKRRQY